MSGESSLDSPVHFAGQVRLAGQAGSAATVSGASLASSPAPFATSSAIERRAPRLTAIDGFRGFGALLVLLYHAWEFCGKPQIRWSVGAISFDPLWFLPGNSRVDLFVVLSGFCLFLPVVASSNRLQKWSPTDYLKRRVLRVVPGYFAALVFAILIPYPVSWFFHLFSAGTAWHKFPDWDGQAIVSLFLFPFGGGYIWSLNPSLWTMGIEFQLCVLLPIMVVLVRRYGVKPIYVSIVLSLLYRALVYADYDDAHDSNFYYLTTLLFAWRWMEFAFGMLAVDFVMKRLRAGQRFSPSLGLLGVLTGLAMHVVAFLPIVQNLPTCQELVLGLAYTLAIVSVCLAPNALGRLVDNRFMARLGYISYSFYLVHMPILYYLAEFLETIVGIHGGTREFVILVPVGFALTLLTTLPFFWFFERPTVRRTPG